MQTATIVGICVLGILGWIALIAMFGFWQAVALMVCIHILTGMK